MIIVYVTHENMAEAEKVVDHLLDKKMIACANYFDMKSCYWWEGAKENSDEIVTILKTVPEKWDELKAEVEKVHPYDVPCIMKLDVEVNEEYEDWVKEEVNSP